MLWFIAVIALLIWAALLGWGLSFLMEQGSPRHQPLGERNGSCIIDHWDDVEVHWLKYIGGLFEDYAMEITVAGERHTIRRREYNYMHWPSCEKVEHGLAYNVAKKAITRYECKVMNPKIPNS